MENLYCGKLKKKNYFTVLLYFNPIFLYQRIEFYSSDTYCARNNQIGIKNLYDKHMFDFTYITYMYRYIIVYWKKYIQFLDDKIIIYNKRLFKTYYLIINEYNNVFTIHKKKK